MLEDQHFDTCVVGAGIAGAMVASRLAKRGLRVVVVEAGKHFKRAERMDQLRSFQVLRTPVWPWENNARDQYVDTSSTDLGYEYRLNQSRVKGVGGSTLHWGGLINRYWESDFRTASTYGLGVDWPLSYADIEPYYCEAESEIGVSGAVSEVDPPRSKPFPMSGFPVKFGESEWQSVADRMGIGLELASHARNSSPYGGRPACSAFSVCNVCPISARYSADFHIEAAVATGLVTLLTETVARRIELSDSGSVSAVRASNLDGDEFEIHADDYVIAAHAIESARLLLLSDVGNQSDQLGRNLMEHWYTGAGGFVDAKIYPRRIGFSTLETSHWYDGPDRQDRGAIKLSFLDGRDPLETGIKDGLLGGELAARDCADFGHWVGVAAEIEHLPNPDSRVTLSQTETDMFGDPIPNIHFALSETDRVTHARALDYAGSLLDARGCRDIEPVGHFVRAHHHMGTCRMSSNPDEGVVDADCRVHGSANLFLAGASVFPTGAGRQPTLTIAALALRLADHLSSHERA